MNENIILYLPWPPTVNNYYVQGNGKSKYISPRGREFSKEVVACVSEQINFLGGNALDGRLLVEVTLFPPDKRVRDLDNHMKALQDALTCAGVWKDDSQIDQLFIYRGQILKNGLAMVEICDAGPLVPVPASVNKL